MVYLEAIIGAVKEEELKDNLMDRLDIVRHKIKFMDKVPVLCYNAAKEINLSFYEAFIEAGAVVQTDLEETIYLIFHQSGTGLNALMRDVPAQLDTNWPPVQNNRVILLDQDAYNLQDAESYMSLVEDLAEMIHPGSFIFGQEGDKWIRFSL